MNHETFAKMLDGREYTEEITEEEEKIAKDNGLVVVFGASDDLVEFRGAISDETGKIDGGDIFIASNGTILEDHEDCDCVWCGYEDIKKESFKIAALWDSDGKHSWIFKTKVPHSTFEIVEDGEPYCQGIVFNLRAALDTIPLD